MALRDILVDDIEFLHKKSRKVTDFDKRLFDLLDDMIQTLHSRKNAVGLAAPQVGILKQVAVIDIGEGVIELINPIIVESSGEQTGLEGCLSFPGVYKNVKRPNCVKVQSFDRSGGSFFLDGAGLLARVFCHEIDHLHGVVFLDVAEDLE